MYIGISFYNTSIIFHKYIHKYILKYIKYLITTWKINNFQIIIYSSNLIVVFDKYYIKILLYKTNGFNCNLVAIIKCLLKLKKKILYKKYFFFNFKNIYQISIKKNIKIIHKDTFNKFIATYNALLKIQTSYNSVFIAKSITNQHLLVIITNYNKYKIINIK